MSKPVKKKQGGVPAGKRATRDPMQGQTSTRSKRGKGVKKGVRSAAPTDRAQCTAHKRNGDRCSNPPVRGAKVCRMHGGSAPQVKAKANQRLIEMILPALAHLRKIIDSPDTADSDKLKAINMVLNRSGYSERQQIDIGLREPTPFDNLTRDAFTIRRGADLAEELSRDAMPELTTPDDVLDDETLDGLLDARDRAREREDEGRISHEGHVVVPGEVQREAMDPFFTEQREREEFARRRSEFDPRAPEDEPVRTYDERLAERVEDPPTPRNRTRRRR
jgi:hypothetical protein